MFFKLIYTNQFLRYFYQYQQHNNNINLKSDFKSIVILLL